MISDSVQSSNQCIVVDFLWSLKEVLQCSVR